MQGAGEAKSIILQSFDTRIHEIEKCGCAKGIKHEEQLNNVGKEVTEIKAELVTKMDKMLDRMFWGMLIMVVLSLMAGIDIAQKFLSIVFSMGVK